MSKITLADIVAAAQKSAEQYNAANAKKKPVKPTEKVQGDEYDYPR